MQGVVTLPFGGEALYMTLYDFERYPSWYFDCADVRVLEAPATHPPIPALADGRFGSIAPGGPWTLFFRQRTPPLDDRWAILRCTYRAGTGGTLLVEFKSVEPHPYPAPKGLVRMQLNGSWILRLMDARHTEVTFQLTVDPRTSAPAFIVNRRLRETVFETLRGLRNAAVR